MKITELYRFYIDNPIISTDSRNIVPGSIFFALKGENFDGNKYAQDAINKGAVLSITEDKTVCNSDKIIYTENSLLLLQELATYHRLQLGIPILAITGTNGKTTTKELISSVLSQSYKAFATKGNFNNDIGVPLTLLEMNSKTEIGIVEMGANHIGEIKMLCEIAKPDFGIITNIGRAHLEGFGSFEGVISAKNELYAYIKTKGGTAFVNIQNELLNKLSEEMLIINYGNAANSELKGKIIENNPFLKISFLINKSSNYIVQTNLSGEYNLENILAAICVGRFFKVENKKIVSAIENYTPSNNRSQIHKTKNNTLLLDAYNSNPTSLKNALSSFNEIQIKNKLLIIGDMLELGKYTDEEHIKIIKSIAKYSFKGVLYVGKHFHKLSKHTKFPVFYSIQELIDYIESINIKDNMILIKGSRGVQLEKIVEYL